METAAERTPGLCTEDDGTKIAEANWLGTFYSRLLTGQSKVHRELRLELVCAVISNW